MARLMSGAQAAPQQQRLEVSRTGKKRETADRYVLNNNHVFATLEPLKRHDV